MGGGLRGLHTGDVIRVERKAGRCDAWLSGEEIALRPRDLPALQVPPSPSPCEAMYRRHTRQRVDGATLDIALKCRRIAERTPHHNH